MHVAVDKVGAPWTMDLKANTCNCREWQVSGVPCVHAMAVILPRRESWENYCNPYLTIDAYKATYAGYIHPINDCQFWKEPQYTLLPPPLFRPPGKLRNNIMKNRNEVAPKKNKKKRCSKYGILGHNKKTCKGTPAIDEYGIRVRPKTRPIEGAAGLSRHVIEIPPALARQQGET
ncbi:hypothetical protein LguiB_011967 [Lonicera macranthoides]